MMEQVSITRDDAAASDLLQLAEELNTLKPAAVCRVLNDLFVNGLPLTTQQAVQLRNSNVASTLVVLLEPSYDVTLRSHALHVISRMCRLDRLCQDSFISYGAVRKLIKNADTTQGNNVDPPAAIRALACLAGGEFPRATEVAAVEDVFLTGLALHMRNELAARCHKPDDPLVIAIGDFLAAVAACPVHHVRLRDASFLPLLPIIMASATASVGGGGAGAVFLSVVYHLSTSDAVAPSMRTESYFEALLGMLAVAPAMSPSRRTALLAICNVFGADVDNVRAEEVLRLNGVPTMMAALLAAALGPADVGAAARATGATPAPAVGAARAGSGGLQRRSGVITGNGSATVASGRAMRISDGGALARSHMSSNGGGGWSHMSSNGGGGWSTVDGTSTATAAAGPQHHSETVTAGWQVRTVPSDNLSSVAASARKNAGNGFALSSITLPGFGGTSGGGGGSRQAAQTTSDGTSEAASPVPLEAVLHSLKCMAANPMHARKFAKPGSPAYVLPSLLDAVVSSLQHAVAGSISRAVLAARASAGAQMLLRLASCAELAPPLRTAGTAAVLRMLASEADDPRVGEAACGALLYMGDTGLMGDATAAAFRALYRNSATLTGPDPEFSSRFQVFVSHHRADAHQFAIFMLHPMLVLQGVPVFVDPTHRTAASDWSHIIASCKNMVVVMSEMLLASPDHVREAETAVAAGVNVIVVVPEGARWSDSQGHKSFDSPPPAVLLALPACLRGIFAENTLPYTADHHGEFTQQLMARLHLQASLPAAATAAAGGDRAAEVVMSTSASAGREAVRLRDGGGDGGGNRLDASRGPSRCLGRSRSDTQGGDDQPPHRVSFGGVGDAFQRLQQQQEEEEREELATSALGGTGTSAGPRPGSGILPCQPPLQQDLRLPWPWSRLLDGQIIVGSDEEDEPVRYRRTLYGCGYGTGTGSLGASLGGTGCSAGADWLPGSAVGESAMGISSFMAAPPPAGTPASYTSRRYMARQRSSINRQVALQLQQQQQKMLVQQQWLQEYQQRAQVQQQQQQQQQQTQGSLFSSVLSAGLSTEDGLVPQGTAAPAVSAIAASMGGLGFAIPAPAGDPPISASALSQLLALQLEMVRYELRQAVQASHDNIAYKIDRLRSDVTEQVVQLRFDLAGKIEALHEALAKSAASGKGGSAPPREPGDATSGAAGSGGGSGGSVRETGCSLSLNQQQHQQLATALSSSLAASLQEAVNRAVAQLQATVAAAGTGIPAKPAPLQPAPASNGPALGQSAIGPNGCSDIGGNGISPTDLAAAATQQQSQQQILLHQGHHHNLHPPPQPSNFLRAGGGGNITTTLAPSTPHPPQGMELLYPVARAGAAAWSGDGSISTAGYARHAPTHGGGTKSCADHATVANGAYKTEGKGGKGISVGGGGGSSAAAVMAGAAVAAATPSPARPGPLSMFYAAVAEDESGNGGGVEGRLVSPTAPVAAVSSPVTAQAALLMAGRARSHVPTSQATSSTVGRGGGAETSRKDRNSSANSAGGGRGNGSGKGTLPPLAGLLPAFSQSAASKLVERTDAQPVRKAQQQLLLFMQQQQQQPHHA